MTLRQEINEFFKHDNRPADLLWLEALPSWTEGDFVLRPDGCPNCWYWVGVSQEVVDTIRDMQEAGEIHFRTTKPLNYFIGGKVPNLPIAKRMRPYKKPRWLPVAVAPGS